MLDCNLCVMMIMMQMTVMVIMLSTIRIPIPSIATRLQYTELYIIMVDNNNQQS